MNDEKITSTRQLIEALGGAEKVAEWLQLASSSAVYNWIKHGEIPPAWHLRLYLRCQQDRIAVDMAVFGLPAAA